ncbi:MAG: class I SAM-dependent methyltransferase [Prevotellaceae bacterium]|jgi:2-polyprenyl-3-methyl-5-hydroxy-6-metoxy-1,4-benzoquinol methylase|nr:class I SAM-dependent methyltransferase [Prevotellaceae bacterium]
MKKDERIPKILFQEDGHYLGKPADFDDFIISRRINLVENIPNFTGTDYTLLEIGCGNGASMFLLSDKMKRCTGVEITHEHKDKFEAYKSKNNIQNCAYQISDVVKNEAQEKFDRIISFEVIEHLSDESGVQFYFDSLKDDGILAISVPNKWWIFETHGAKLPLLPWNRVPLFSWLPKPIHEKFANARIYTKRRIKNLLEKYGFEVLQSYYVTAPMDVLPNGKFKDWVIKKFFRKDTTKIPFKATSIFVVAKKLVK